MGLWGKPQISAGDGGGKSGAWSRANWGSSAQKTHGDQRSFAPPMLPSAAQDDDFLEALRASPCGALSTGL